MSETVADDIKRWTAKRKSALVIEIIRGKTTVAGASRTYDLAPSEVEGWVDDAKKGMENALKANPLDVRQQSTRSSSATCRRPMARLCWSSEPEKSSRPSWSGRTAIDPDAS